MQRFGKSSCNHEIKLTVNSSLAVLMTPRQFLSDCCITRREGETEKRRTVRLFPGQWLKQNVRYAVRSALHNLTATDIYARV